jgi:hypothetical protein
LQEPAAARAPECSRGVGREGYHCAGKDIVDGRGQYCLTMGGGLAIEQAVANAFLDAITPAALEATMLSVQQLQVNHDAALSQWRLEAERQPINEPLLCSTARKPFVRCAYGTVQVPVVVQALNTAALSWAKPKVFLAPLKALKLRGKLTVRVVPLVETEALAALRVHCVLATEVAVPGVRGPRKVVPVSLIRYKALALWL